MAVQKRGFSRIHTPKQRYKAVGSEREDGSMTTVDAKSAFLEGAAVTYNRTNYLCISALIYRKRKKEITVSLELLDKSGNSVTIAEPRRVERTEAAQ